MGSAIDEKLNVKTDYIASKLFCKYEGMMAAGLIS